MVAVLLGMAPGVSEKQDRKGNGGIALFEGYVQPSGISDPGEQGEGMVEQTFRWSMGKSVRDPLGKLGIPMSEGPDGGIREC